MIRVRSVAYLVVAFLLFSLLAVGCKAGGYQVAPDKLASTPDKYPVVVAAPNPALVGHFTGTGNQASYAYWLGMKGDKYAFYDKWTGNQWVAGSAAWVSPTINGDQITFDNGFRYFVENGKVYCQYKDRDRVPLTKVE